MSTRTLSPFRDRNRLLPGIAIHDQVDLTGLANGFHTLALLAALRGQPDPATDETTLRVRTPSGGLHIWYRAAATRRFLCSTGSSTGRALAWQVDVRANGGYIVAPGTRTAAGTYTPLGQAQIPAPLAEWLATELDRTGHSTSPNPIAPRLPTASRSAPAKRSSEPEAAATALPRSWRPSWPM